ncbi:hypothetical protein ACIOHS_22750 [Streptomyces sp. NPDC088253]|uniref:hypothetical protein n=1 Tax=Streptomyces sp. NPDC088253 TaxID=3365846 RepID=UPI00380F05E9
MGDRGERLQYGLGTPDGFVGLVPDFGQLVEVFADLPCVPGEQDRLDVRKVRARRRPDPHRRHMIRPLVTAWWSNRVVEQRRGGATAWWSNGVVEQDAPGLDGGGRLGRA